MRAANLKLLCRDLAKTCEDAERALDRVADPVRDQASATNVVDLFKGRPEYDDDQPRDADGQWSGGSGGSRARGRKAPKAPAGKPTGSKKPSIQQLATKFRAARDKRRRVKAQIASLQRRLRDLRARSPSYARAAAKLRELKAQRAELTREMGRLSDQVAARRGPQAKQDWFQSMLAGFPVMHRGPRRGLKRAQADDDIDLFDIEKGYPEFDPDQPRDGNTGRWVAGSGTSARTQRRRRQQAREAAEGKKPKKTPRKPTTTEGKPKPKQPKPEAKPKRPPRKPREAPRVEEEKPPVVSAPPQQEERPTALVPVPRADTPIDVEAETVPARPSGLIERDNRRLEVMYDRFDAATAEVDAIDSKLSGLQDKLDAIEVGLANARDGSWRRHSLEYDEREYDAQFRALERKRARVLSDRKAIRDTIDTLESRLRGSNKRLITKRADFTKRSGSLYVCRRLLNGDDLARWAKAEGFETTTDPHDMHVTIAASRDALAWPGARNSKLVIRPSANRSMELLGKDGEAAVLRFSSQHLSDRWEQFRDAGASWDFPSYKPHVTISYRVPEGLDINAVKPYTGELVFGPEEFKEFNEDPEHTEKAREVVESIFKRDRSDIHCMLFKADSNLGLIFGWAIVSSENGQPYYDTQGDHIPEDAVLEAAADFMMQRRTLKIMHAGKKVGTVVFAWPMTEEIAEAMGIQGKRTGLMIAVKPDNPSVLARFRSNQYTGFSIGGNRLVDEEVD